MKGLIKIASPNEYQNIITGARLNYVFSYSDLENRFEKLEAKINQRCGGVNSNQDYSRNVTYQDGSYPKGNISLQK